MEELTAAIEALLTERNERPVRVRQIRPLAGGACQDLFDLTLALDDQDLRLVLRSDAQSLPESIGCRREFPVVQAARRAGVPTPRVRWLAHDLVRPGADAYFLDWVDGVALGGKVVRAPALAAARDLLPGQLAEALAAVHRVTRETDPELPLDPSEEMAPSAWRLARTRELLDAVPTPRPALELALAWLAENPPAAEEVTLAHGDFRTGNFLVGPTGLRALLDWEFAHWSSPMEDLAWFCVRDWRFGRLDRPAGGLADRATFYRAYEEASGRRVDPAVVHWWEVLGNLNWAIGALQQTSRFFAGRLDFELLAIGRRAGEMEWEALRLIERGP